MPGAPTKNARRSERFASFVNLPSVDLPPVADANDHDEDLVVADLWQQAIISDAITPPVSKVPCQRLAVAARIGGAFEIFADLAEDERCGMAIELF